jgi:hypothetical protein
MRRPSAHIDPKKRWFRFYDDAINDFQVQTLPPAMFKIWVNVLCTVSAHGWQMLDHQDTLAMYLRVQKRTLKKAMALFRERGLLEEKKFKHFSRPNSLRNHSSEWWALRTRVFERDDYTCRYCGARGGKLECDHIIPVSRGGSDDLSNLATACFPCNRSKRDKTPEEWLQ